MLYGPPFGSTDTSNPGWGSPVLPAVVLTDGGKSEAGLDDDVRVAVGPAVAAATLSLTDPSRDEFSSTIPSALPENSVNHTTPRWSSTESMRGDELLAGMRNSVSCWLVGSNRAILFATCSLNHTYPSADTKIQ
jgi:hypothetical protein